MTIAWEYILMQALGKIVEALLPWTLEKLKELLEDAWEKAEEWASELQKKFGKKPSGEQKMQMAVMMVRSAEPELEPAEVRSMMEMEHLCRTTTRARVGKTA